MRGRQQEKAPLAPITVDMCAQLVRGWHKKRACPSGEARCAQGGFNSGVGPAFEDQGGVGATKAEAVGHDQIGGSVQALAQDR